MVWLSAHKALNHNLGVTRKMKWCKGEYIIFFGYLKVRKTKFLIKYMILLAIYFFLINIMHLVDYTKEKKLFALRCSRYFRVSSS